MNIIIHYFMNVYNFLLLYKSYFFVIFFIILIFIIIILFSLCCYFLYKFFHIKFKNIYLDNYHGDSEKLLLKYGDKRIKNVYLIKEKLYYGYTNFLIKFLKYIFKRNYDLDNLFHTSFMFDIDLGNNIIKKIKLNKNFYLNITDNFRIYNYQEIKCNKIKNKKYTLNYILNKTKKNINSKKFFNWNVTYNCQFFTKKILSSMKLLNSSNLKFVEYINVYNLSKKVKYEDKMFYFIHSFFLNILVFIYKLIF